MTKVKLLTNKSQKLRELLNHINTDEPLSLELDLGNDEYLVLNLQVSKYEKINIINNLFNKDILINGLYITNNKNVNNSYTLTNNYLNNKLFVDTKDLNKEVELRLVDILRSLGINPSHLGYSYLKEGILYVFSSNHIISNMTEVYKKISHKYNSTYASVESSIRRAIEEGFKNASPDDIKKIFGYTLNYQTVSPTNSTFIITISDLLKTEYNRYN